MTKGATKRMIFIYFQPLRVLMERDDDVLSEQMKELKEKVKIKMMNDVWFDVDDYIVDECCEGRKYRIIHDNEVCNPF